MSTQSELREATKAPMMVSEVVFVQERSRIFDHVEAELAHAYRKHGGAQWGRHEFYAILLEEVEELWEAIKKDDHPVLVQQEAIQVIAMCVRYLETGDRYQQPPSSAGG